MEPFLKLGTRSGAYGSGPFRLPLEDRRKHTLISGKTGTGKSTLLANLFAQDANSGRGCLLIDPNGDLAEQALDLIPPRRIRKTIYLNPSDTAHPVGFNVLDGVRPEHRATVADDIVGAFRAVFADSWGPRLDQILYNTIAALLEAPGSTLLCVPQMLLNKPYRATVLAQVEDPFVLQFWREEFPGIEKKFGSEATGPVLNKIGKLLSSPIVRNIIGQPKSAINPRHLIDNNYLIVANFSKGLLGTNHANLLGAMLISAFGAAAMSRADIPADQRKDFALIVDEFPNYTTTAFTSLLSEARKYRLSLTLAHQYLAQMSDPVRAAVFGNIGTLIAFRVGVEDAQIFARQLDPLEPRHVAETSNYEAWCRTLQYGQQTDTFLLKTPRPPLAHGNTAKIIAHSRIHFATQRQKIEKRIARFMASPQDEDIEPF